MAHRRRSTHSPRRTAAPRSTRAIVEFLRSEATGGIALVVATAIALLWANLHGSYFATWDAELTLGWGPVAITEDLRHWINDGLMTLFFFVVALEIKRELAIGELRDRRAAALPVLAAFGGAILPAIIFTVIVAGDGVGRGWAIPMATDIAFAVGILALLGNRVPLGVKLLLVTIAIVDDVIAIAVIAVAYTESLSMLWLAGALAGGGSIVLMRRAGVTALSPYVAVGIVIWLATLQSGVHATMAGVAIGLLTPAQPIRGRLVLDELVQRLHPCTSLLVVPLFALANAGIVLDGSTITDALDSSLAWAIALGLVAGKLLGIGGTVFALVRTGLGTLPSGVTASHVWGVAALGGVGFTVSLFIAQLSYADPQLVDIAKIGIFAGSAVSALIGVVLLRHAVGPSDSGGGGIAISSEAARAPTTRP